MEKMVRLLKVLLKMTRKYFEAWKTHMETFPLATEIAEKEIKCRHSNFHYCVYIPPWNISIYGSLFIIPFDAVSSELLMVLLNKPQTNRQTGKNPISGAIASLHMEMSLLENDFNMAYLSSRVHNSKFAAVHCPLLCLTHCVCCFSMALSNLRLSHVLSTAL
jgi:hypothetical protein